MARGWVPRGYDYLGPGNDLHRGPPRNENDVLAQDHDTTYTALLQAGGRPYTQWSEADRRFYESLTVEDIPTAVAKGLFGLKKGLHTSGLIDATDSQSNLRGRANMARSGTLRGSTRFNEETAREARLEGESRRQRAEREREVREARVGLDGTLTNSPGEEDSLDANAGTLLDDMEVPGNDGEDTGNAMMAFAGGDGGSAQSKETPISIPPSITYGLQETHTTILPWNGWVSAVNMDYNSQVQLPIRMNGLSDLIPTTLGSVPLAGAAFVGKGIFPNKLSSASVRSYYDFPAVMLPGATADERPWWRNYWFDIYEYYTVLKCHYEIIIENPIANGNALNNSVIIGTQFDSYSDAASTVGNVMPQALLVEAMSYKGMRWEKLDSQSPNEQQGRDSNRTVISGTWMPGMTKRNIINDGDVKTWTAATAAAVPNLKEILTINFWRHPLAQANLASQITGVNIQMNIKYVVQFKDLRQQARYPNAISSGQNLQQNLNDSWTTGDAYQAPMQ